MVRFRTCVAVMAAASVMLSGVSAHAFGAGSKPVYGPSAPEKSSTASLPGDYKQTKAKKRSTGVEPLRGPWRLTKSLKNKGKEPVDEDGNVYACTDKDCKVSRKVDEKRD